MAGRLRGPGPGRSWAPPAVLALPPRRGRAPRVSPSPASGRTWPAAPSGHPRQEPDVSPVCPVVSPSRCLALPWFCAHPRTEEQHRARAGRGPPGGGGRGRVCGQVALGRHRCRRGRVPSSGPACHVGPHEIPVWGVESGRMPVVSRGPGGNSLCEVTASVSLCSAALGLRGEPPFPSPSPSPPPLSRLPFFPLFLRKHVGGVF